MLSLFTGAMGLDIGLERHGFKTVLAIEQNKHAQTTIKKNRSDVMVLDDVFSINPLNIQNLVGQVDAIVGGPPCQSWSHAGKRLGLEDQRGLCIPRFLEFVTSLLPKIVVLENVHGLLTASVDGEKGAVVRMILDTLQTHGYQASMELVNSANFGVPQKRQRIVIIGILNGKTTKLAPTHGQNGLPKWNTLLDAIGDRPQGKYLPYPESRAKFFRLLSAGQDWRNLPEELKADAMKGALLSGGGRTGFFRRLSWDKPCPTLTCSPLGKANAFCHPDEDRPLNVKEYARIQGFPDDWIFCGPLAAQYKQIGNAVPVQLSEAIAKACCNSHG